MLSVCIDRIHLTIVAGPLRRPIRVAFAARTATTSLVVQVWDTEGHCGLGECCEVPAFSGATAPMMLAVVRDAIAPRLASRRFHSIGEIRQAIESSIPGNPFPKSAVEMACLDLWARAAGLAVTEFLGGRRRRKMPVCGSVSIGPTRDMVAEAEEQVNEGYRYLKVYTGTSGDWRKDVEQVLAVHRAVGDAAQLTLDVNRRWDPNSAARALQELEGAIILVEQPVTPEAMRAGRFDPGCTTIPVFADEAVYSAADVAFLAGLGQVVDGVNLYVTKAGGFLGALEAVATAEACQLDYFIGSFNDLGIGTAAGLSLAAAVSSSRYPDYVFGATKLQRDIIRESFKIEEGEIEVPGGPGLGVTLHEEALRAVAVGRTVVVDGGGAW